MKTTFYTGVLAGLLACAPLFAAEERDVVLRLAGPEERSSFSQLLWVHVANPAFTPMNLMDLMASSQLLIDGKASQRSDRPFRGAPGIRPGSEWNGCLLAEEYDPPIAPGKHRVQLRLGQETSREITVTWRAPVDWRKGNLESRRRDVRGIANAIVKGLPRSCVEQWLTTPDGGLERTKGGRYFLEPQFKIDVPYTDPGDQGRDDQLVDGPVQVYEESRIVD